MTTPIVIGTLWGMSAAQLADALAPADPDLCGWLDGSCSEPHTPDGWLCTSHLKRITAGA
jgi:hypothetical protein